MLVGTIAQACSTKGGEPASAPSSSPTPTNATVMVDGHSHTISGEVDCRTTPTQPSATPAESGSQTTRISAHDDTASVSLSLSDATPPGVNGFAISLNAASATYQMPYQAVQSPNQVQASRQGNSYTVTGTGKALAPGQGGMRDLPFEIDVTCS
ncbi:lipoprotein LpqH [Mycobacterium lacus]|nr:lipoprotein LpqH [Mycobacterium lacus]